MLIEPDFSSLSIVLVGSFNPKIFTPDWFARNELLTTDDADNAEIEVIHPQIARFHTDWLNLQVDSNRLSADTTGSVIRLRDLIVKTFQEKLSHTPITALGINREVHFSVGSIEKRDEIGYKLAPLEPWGEWSKDLKRIDDKRRGGMKSLVMLQNICDDRSNGHIQATVSPSNKIDHGIFMQVNDHYALDENDNQEGCEQIIRYLDNQFDTSVGRSGWIIDQIMALK